MVRIPTHRPPTSPGDILVHEYLEPLGMTQVELAARIHVPFQRVNAIVNGHRGVTPDTALRLGKLFGTSPDFWLNLQQAWDLYQAVHSNEAEVLRSIEPVGT
jgi:antitoxin HigA-1